MLYHNSKHVTAAGDVTSRPAVLRAITICPTTAAGTLEVRDGSGASDPVVIKFTTGAGDSPTHIPLGDGFAFKNKVNVKTFSSLRAVVFWF